MVRSVTFALALVLGACSGSEFTADADAAAGGSGGGGAGTGGGSAGTGGGSAGTGGGVAGTGGAAGAGGGAAGTGGRIAGSGGAGAAGAGGGGGSGGSTGGSGGAGGSTGGAGGNTGGSGGAGGTTTTLATCATLYGGVMGLLQVCDQTATTCTLSVDTDPNDGDPGQPCAALCAARGGECLNAYDNGSTACTVDTADPRPCADATMSEGICVCSRGCGTAGPCPSGKKCAASKCA